VIISQFDNILILKYLGEIRKKTRTAKYIVMLYEPDILSQSVKGASLYYSKNHGTTKLHQES